MNKTGLILIFFILTNSVIYSVPEFCSKDLFNSDTELLFTEDLKVEFFYEPDNRLYNGTYLTGGDSFGDYIKFDFGDDSAGFVRYLEDNKCYYVFAHGVLVLYLEDIIIDILFDLRRAYMGKEVLGTDYISDTVLIEDASNPDLYSTDNLFDPDNSTQDLRHLWVEGREGPGVSETIEASLNTSFNTDTHLCVVEAVVIFNGYFSSESLYYKNNRVKEAVIECKDDRTEIVLEDIRKPQIFELNMCPTNRENIYFTIDSVYSGTEWDDTCISKLIYIGKIAHLQG